MSPVIHAARATAIAAWILVAGGCDIAGTSLDSGDEENDAAVSSDGEAVSYDAGLRSMDAPILDGESPSPDGAAASVEDSATPATPDAWSQDGRAMFRCGVEACGADSVCRSFERADPTCVHRPDACGAAGSGSCSDEGPSGACSPATWACVDALCGWGGIEAARRGVLSDGGRSVFCYAL